MLGERLHRRFARIIRYVSRRIRDACLLPVTTIAAVSSEVRDWKLGT
jgi:hypothetical protein